MCESCTGGGFDRRDFLKIGGAAAALGTVLATTALAQNEAALSGGLPSIEKKKTKMTVLFMYPSDETIDAGRTEDGFSSPGWYTWPGNQFEPEMNREKYTKKIVEFAKAHDIDLDFQGVAGTKNEVAAFIAKTKEVPPDTLLVVNFWNSFSKWVLEMSQQLAPLSMIVYHPVGSNHQHPPKGLMTAPGMEYIHSVEHWEALENAMIAANTKKMMAQSRVLRIGGYKEQSSSTDKNLGVDIVAVPAAEYNDLFDSVKPDDAMIREAMAFKGRATAVTDVEDQYFVNAFRSRAAILNIMKRYGADGITIRCLLLQERKPCVAFSLCNGALVPCGCEDDLPATLSMMIGTNLFKRGGFQHNPDFDINRNQYFGAHCQCTLKLHGPDKPEIPFRIRPFMHQLPKTAALDVRIPPGEKMFLLKYTPSQKQIVAFTGTMAASPESNSAGGCTTRFVMDIDKVDDVCSIYHGPHPILYCGTVMEAKRIKAFAKLTELEFVGNV